MPHYGLERSKTLAEWLVWIPFGGATIVAVWWLAAALGASPREARVSRAGAALVSRASDWPPRCSRSSALRPLLITSALTSPRTTRSPRTSSRSSSRSRRGSSTSPRACSSRAPLRAEMRAQSSRLPAGLEESTRAALKAGDGRGAERGLMVFFVGLARDLALEADRRLADRDASRPRRGWPPAGSSSRPSGATTTWSTSPSASTTPRPGSRSVSPSTRRRAMRRHPPPRRGRRSGVDQRAAGGRARSREDARAAPADRADALGAHRNVLDIPKEGLMKKQIMGTRSTAGRLARAARMAGDGGRAQKVVKIGDLGSKVGVFEGYGKYQTMAIQMAVEELNAKGGVLGHKVEIISEDDETKPAPAVRKAEKLILQDDVKLLIGAVSQRRDAGGDGRDEEAQGHPLELGVVRGVHADDQVPQVLLLESAGLADAGQRAREIHRRQDGQEGLHLLHRLRDGPVRRAPVQDGAREARRRGGRRGGRAARHQGLQPVVRRHQPGESRRALRRLRRAPTRSV